MKIIRKAGDTSNILQIFIQDSSSTTGAGLTGLANNTSGLTAYYHKDTDTTATAISLVTMTVGTFTSSGFKEIDSTNMPGWYQFCPPDAALSTSGTPKSVGFHLKGATNMAPLAIEVQLVSIDVQDTVRAGLTALPNAAANAAGGLPISSAGGLDLDEMNVDIEAIQTSTAGLTYTVANQVDVNVLDWKSATAPAMTGDAFARLGAPAGASIAADLAEIEGETDTLLAGVIVTTNNDKTGYSLTQTFPTNFSSLGISAGGHISNVDTLTTYTGNTVQTGDAYARLGAPAGASVSADVAAVKTDTAAVKVQTDKLTFTVANQVDSNVLDWKSATAPAMTGDAFARLGAPAGASIAADLAEIEAETDTLLAGVIVTTNNDKTGYSVTSNIKKNATGRLIFTLTDSTTHTPKTGITVTAQVSIDGAAFVACANSVAEISNGDYTLALAAADTNGNALMFRFTGTNTDDLNLFAITQP